ncbi:MAG: hypothetical protein KatS3mg124_1534 [Porticoccaceae bacterium]|nr:MAG: hypothetical protein KatS3mg124_1534 [Porticoccaceae bacterium]
MDDAPDLIGFLAGFHELRSKPRPRYADERADVLWAHRLPRKAAGVRSPFVGGEPEPWLAVAKPPPPHPPSLGDDRLAPWLAGVDLADPEREPALRDAPAHPGEGNAAEVCEEEVAREAEAGGKPETSADDPCADWASGGEPAGGALEGEGREAVPAVAGATQATVEPYPRAEAEEALARWLAERWRPWAEEERRRRSHADLWRWLDRARRRLEEAPERYELVLAMGLLQWSEVRSPGVGEEGEEEDTGRGKEGATAVRRHLLVAPLELEFAAERGEIRLLSAGRFRLELDMLPAELRPRVEPSRLDRICEALEDDPGNVAPLAEFLNLIGNQLAPDAVIEPEQWEPPMVEGTQPHLCAAPAFVLWERRETGFAELCGQLWDAREALEQAGDAWRLLLGDVGADSPAADAPAEASAREVQRCYFPLPANEEQRRIAELLDRHPLVLVKGPPGTGKSQTIANLICHLLARGERVLITAHAPRALEVLRDKLPESLRPLCVAALGASREEQRILEESLGGILERADRDAPEALEREARRLEERLGALEAEQAEVINEQVALREAEVHPLELAGRYRGKPAEIARQLAEEAETLDWGLAVAADAPFPLSDSELDELAALLPDLAPRRGELAQDLGPDDLPDAPTFARWLQEAAAFEAQWDSDPLATLALSEIEALEEAVARLEVLAAPLEDHGGAFAKAVGDLMGGQAERWIALCAALRGARERAANPALEEVTWLETCERARLVKDLDIRIQHLEAGKWRGLGPLGPAPMRTTRHLLRSCRVAGRPPRTLEALRLLRDRLALEEELAGLCRDLGVEAPATWEGKRAWLASCGEALEPVLAFFGEGAGERLRDCAELRAALASTGGRLEARRRLEKAARQRRARDARAALRGLAERLAGAAAAEGAHPVVAELGLAVQEQSVESWERALDGRAALLAERRRLERAEELLAALEADCPGIGTRLWEFADQGKGQAHFVRLRDAWLHAATRARIRCLADPQRAQVLERRLAQIEEEIARTTTELVACRAWAAFLARFRGSVREDLVTWRNTLRRLGKGAGKHAAQHRRDVRRYMERCASAIAAWILPLWRVWQSARSEVGQFDTAIVDEASQASLEALLLFALARRVVVVGDDKQNSPEAVGVPEEKIQGLIRSHLRNHPHASEFRPDASLYDHADRIAPGRVVLRQHFRCVPEIIAFSNRLCYTEAPLIPLRQPEPDRLPPLTSVLVREGHCRGERSHLLNEPEAEALVVTLCRLVKDPRYRGKTFGVISLQGQAQAQYIERLLAERLDERVFAERRLRCGTPASFQGDERDVILLSMVIAPNKRFRALGSAADQRRYNVAMSRARDQVWLFHSVTLEQLNPDDLRAQLLRHFFDPGVAPEVLAEEKRLEEALMRDREAGLNPPYPYESWFEVDVALALLQRGFRVRSQVVEEPYRIDLVVEGDHARLAVECDGDEWHGADRYAADLARQRQLERAGWRFVRVRASSFYADRQAALEAVAEAAAALGIRPWGRRPAAPPEAEDTESAPLALAEEHSAGQSGVDCPAAPLAPAVGGAAGRPAGGGNGQILPDPRRVPRAQLEQALLHLLVVYAPVDRETLLRHYVTHCGEVERLGPRIRKTLEQALEHLVERRLVMRDGLDRLAPAQRLNG